MPALAKSELSETTSHDPSKKINKKAFVYADLDDDDKKGKSYSILSRKTQAIEEILNTDA